MTSYIVPIRPKMMSVLSVHVASCTCCKSKINDVRETAIDIASMIPLQTTLSLVTSRRSLPLECRSRTPVQYNVNNLELKISAASAAT
ncbi:hypothetical protein O3P69_008155 [Scylla paramamosain]|uniref:Uncharacterized protein n=1 Tax=Scylla paramamosain TaxID=85552 RepID=A0AAW0T0V5_SCYPA